MKYIGFIFVVLYLYSLTYDIFLTQLIRVPAPLFFCLPVLLIFHREPIKFLYGKELILFSIAMFCYYVIGLSDHKAFVSNIMTIAVCATYFNYFIGTDLRRFQHTVFIFIAFLTFSAFVMVINPFYPGPVNAFRSMMMGEPVLQSPSGIAVYQFTYGYQLAALVPFLFISTFVFKRSFLLKTGSLLLCLGFIYLGMQRSVLVGFLCSSLLFLWLYYSYRAIFIIALAAVAAILLYTYVLKDNFDGYNNILNKNEQASSEYNRSTLTAENLRIYAEYPYGLIFYGKTWGDVIYRNQVFSSGITSHNAYLMFLTYLGPFLGIGLLLGLYYRVLRISINALRNAKKQEMALMICLCASLLAVSINSLSHNAWLMSANGPTCFLYFAILQLDHILKNKKVDLLEPLTDHSLFRSYHVFSAKTVKT